MIWTQQYRMYNFIYKDFPDNECIKSKEVGCMQLYIPLSKLAYRIPSTNPTSSDMFVNVVV